jgi:hypothetical protein
VSPKKNTHRKDAKGAKQIIVFTVNLDFPPFAVGTTPMGFSKGRSGTVPLWTSGEAYPADPMRVDFFAIFASLR